MKENNEKKMENCDEISKLIKAFPKDIAALDQMSHVTVGKMHEWFYRGTARDKKREKRRKGAQGLFIWPLSSS